MRTLLWRFFAPKGTTRSGLQVRRFDISRLLPQVCGLFDGRHVVVVHLALASVAALAGENDRRFTLDIPAARASEAVKRLARQTGHSVIFESAEIENINTRPIAGRYTLRQALDALLYGTRLRGSLTAGGIITISPISPAASSNARKGETTVTGASSEHHIPEKRILNRLASAFALVVATLSSSLLAQEPAEQQAQAIEEITIYGSRYRAKQEIAAKRGQDVIFDSLSADEIANVPDFNIADAFRRVAGVSAEFDEDEGRFITVRGIDSNLNRVTFDGITIPSTGSFGGSGRNVNVEFLPSTSVKDLEIYKSFNPSIDGSSIGGYVNVKTRSAYDVAEDYLVGKATLSHYWNDIPGGNDLPVRFELTGSRLFGANDQFGVVFTGLYSKRPRDQQKFFGVAPRSGIKNPDNAAIPPNRFNTSIYSNDQSRFGGNGRLEYRDEDTYAYLSGYLYKQEETEVRFVNNVTGFGGNDVSITGPTTGDITDVRFDVTSSDFPIEKQGKGIHFHIEQDFAYINRLSFDVGYTKASFDHDTWDANFRFDPSQDPNKDRKTPREVLDFSYDLASIVPTRTALAQAELTQDASRYFNNFFRFRDLNTDEDILEFKLDFRRNADSDSQGLGFATGLGYRRQERTRDNDHYRFIGSKNKSLINFADVVSKRTFNSRFQPEPFVMIDADAVRRSLAEIGLDGDALQFDERRSNEEDFSYKEDIIIAYLQAGYAGERFKLSGGLRYEDTRFESTARNEADSNTKGDFSNLLPSVNFTWFMRDDLRLRLGYSKTLGRPNPGDLVSTLRIKDLTQNPSGETGRDDDVELIVNRGNPDLQARESDNIDASLEYYFLDGEGLLSLAWFKKNISGDIFRSEEIGVFNGRPTEFRQNRNLEKSSMDGVELTLYMGALDFLPGHLGNTGISANFTWLNGEMQVPVDDEIRNFNQRFRQPDYIVNASLFYNTKKFEARLTYNYTDSFVLNLGRAEENYEQWDASLKYRASANWQLKLTGRNLTGNPRRQYDDFEDYGFDFLFGQTEIEPSYHLALIYVLR